MVAARSKTVTSLRDDISLMILNNRPYYTIINVNYQPLTPILAPYLTYLTCRRRGAELSRPAIRHLQDGLEGHGEARNRAGVPVPTERPGR